MKFRLTIISFLISISSLFAQQDSASTSTSDSIGKPATIVKRPSLENASNSKKASDIAFIKDSSNLIVDSLVLKTAQDSLKKNISKKVVIIRHPIDNFYIKLLDNPFFRTTQRPVYLIVNERKVTTKDELFYLICGLVFLLAFIKLAFDRYFSSITKLFFQPTVRQKQTKEQLLQSNLPSFFLNLFFVLSAGAYVTLLTQYYQLSDIRLLKLIIYISAVLLVLYTTKYIILLFAGWVFNVHEAVDSYSFIVFLVNKVLGILLLPFVVVIAFSQKSFVEMAVIISVVMIAIMFIYRFIASFGPVMKEIKVGIFHFILYIIALEVIPLFLIYKILIVYLYK